MRIKFIAWIQKDGGLWFGKDDRLKARFHRWLKENPGMKIMITPADEPSGQIRRFFEGAVVPYFALQHEIDGQFLTLAEARKMLRREFNPEYVKRLDGKVETTAGSTTELNKAAFQKFIDDIIEYMDENGYATPDSEDFKRWEKSAPEAGAIYPPLAQLIHRKKEIQAKRKMV